MAFCLAAGCADGNFLDRDRDRNPGPDPLTGMDRRPVPVSNFGDGRSPAALASARDGVSGLGIRNDNPDPNVTRDRTVQTTGWTGANSTDTYGTARLGTPTTGAPVDTRSSPVASTVSTVNTTGRVRTFEEAQQLLMARGVKSQELHQRDTGEWSFSCSMPIANQAGRMKTYEATDKYGLLAIQKVIDKMNQDGR
jgi:hypothetical protein